jgi:hypothetical protein
MEGWPRGALLGESGFVTSYNFAGG